MGIPALRTFEGGKSGSMRRNGILLRRGGGGGIKEPFPLGERGEGALPWFYKARPSFPSSLDMAAPYRGRKRCVCVSCGGAAARMWGGGRPKTWASGGSCMTNGSVPFSSGTFLCSL